MVTLIATDELTLARLAADGDSAAAVELRQRLVRCVMAVSRRAPWSDALDAAVLEEDIPNEAQLRIINRARQGFDGDLDQFRQFIYHVIVLMAADALRRSLDRRKDVSLDTPFENADGEETSLRDFVENEIRAGRAAIIASETREGPIVEQHPSELCTAVRDLDDWCHLIVCEAVIRERSNAAIARDNRVSPQLLDVSMKRCMERLYRNVLSAYATGPDRLFHAEVAAAAERLTDDQRAVFVPWWVQRRSIRRISESLGLDVREARRRLSRAKAEVWAIIGG